MMPTGYQSEIRNKAVFPSPPKEGLTERVETGYPQGNIRERTGKSQCAMHNAQCGMCTCMLSTWHPPDIHPCLQCAMHNVQNRVC